MSVGKRKLIALISMGILACGGEEDADVPEQGQGDGGGILFTDAAFSTKPPVDAGQHSNSGGDASHTSNNSNNTCATVKTGVALQPVHLAFAFDVSGSMGMGDKPWHDKTLKWDPVVKATKAFFASPSSAGLTASLTFFPVASSADMCKDSAYDQPDVSLTALPSASFASAIDAVAPKTSSDWRKGTPTLAVMKGTADFVAGARATEDGRYAIVLVTDGYPQGCTNDAVSAVVTEAKKSLAADLPTYVIGVANPAIAGAPDTVSALHSIAAAGGTKQAVLIDTGNPDATASALGAAIEQIRTATISCNIDIPKEQAGAEFDKQSVLVHFNGNIDLKYDKSCSGSNGWHYDNVNDPHQIVLCDQTCTTVRADPDAELSVEFSCEHVLVI